jgi:hypothetical protein
MSKVQLLLTIADPFTSLALETSDCSAIDKITPVNSLNHFIYSPNNVTISAIEAVRRANGGSVGGPPAVGLSHRRLKNVFETAATSDVGVGGG